MGESNRGHGLLLPFGLERQKPQALSVGLSHGCLLTHEGRPRCWSLFLNWSPSPEDPAYLQPPDEVLVDIATPRLETCGLSPSGKLTCHGGYASPWWNTSGRFESIESGTGELCALTPTKHLRCWQEPDEPLNPIPDLSNIQQISLDASQGCALLPDGTARCFGTSPQNRDYRDPSRPLVALDAGTGVACGVASDASLVCWGGIADGLGPPPPGQYQHVSCGMGHCCALTTDGTARCWGDNTYGQLDIPDADDLR